MSSIDNMAASPGIPGIITTMEGSEESDLGDLMDRIQLAIDPTSFKKSDDLASDEKDESTADETCLESSSGLGSYPNHSQDDSDEEESADDASDSSDDDSFSVQSHHTNDSARDLLKQAQQRLNHQSVYEEVKQLRVEVAQKRNSAEASLREKLEMKHRMITLESQLASALETIQSYKQKELRWNEEKAVAEKDFMNQLNDVCRGMEEREQDLMGEILKRDRKIIELQNNWNEQEMRRMNKAREKEKSDMVTYVETRVMKEMNLDDDSWNDESSCEFI